ncbi:hypothetical protein IFM89_022111 [Coptis chinensis]|uniref:Uncharacterized protein n=1 Tax=Coptis chinensis TaxID=261450 RepID=A0A835LW72_9MAGN|nr:hypothetical protein IFM89_022111 [Coptis chinensis]
MFCMDEEVEDVLWRLFEAENAVEILMGISKEIIGHLQINQFSLNSSIQREGEMRYKLGISSASFHKSIETRIETLEANLVSPELSEMKVVIEDLEVHLLEVETKAETAEAKCSLLEEVLNEELALLKDMENLINDLKSKVLRAEIIAEKSKAKCASLSETNSELNEEVSFSRDRMESLETSLHQADEENTITANEINKRAKVITDMVMQLARET